MFFFIVWLWSILSIRSGLLACVGVSFVTYEGLIV